VGPVDAECPNFLHSAPFGNWGVTSNFGKKQDGHQFDGWCHDAYVCDNDGNCGTVCRDGWYEWNSCTSHPRFSAPNCSLYNTEDCASQVTGTGVNVYGAFELDIPVRCPLDTDGDQRADAGGCLDAGSYDPGQNFLSLYELDPVTADELVQTLYFPPTPITPDCSAYGCLPVGSEWVAPVAYDSPTSPAKVYAEMAVAIGGGDLLDPFGLCQIVAPPMTTVSAASYSRPSAAPASIVSSFGSSLAERTEAASKPLPLSLGGVSVELIDAVGVARRAPMLLASGSQINWVVPAGTALGPASVRIRGAASDVLAIEQLSIEPVAPALFTADASGSGVAAALAVRVSPDGTQNLTEVFVCGDGTCAALPLSFGGDDLFLVLFGTGIRGADQPGDVVASIDGEPATVTYAGPQSEFDGLDQVNVKVPRTLAGRGQVNVVITAAEHSSNAVTVRLAE